MEQIQANLPEIKIVGIKVRTGSNSLYKISNLAQEYFQNSIAMKIPNRKNPGISYIAYLEYESNYKGNYTCFIGEEVTEIGNLDNNLESHIIPAQNYVKFTTDSGSMPDIVIKSWMEIWQMEELEKKRSYKTDFEIYGPKALDPQNAVVDIYIGVK